MNIYIYSLSAGGWKLKFKVSAGHAPSGASERILPCLFVLWLKTLGILSFQMQPSNLCLPHHMALSPGVSVSLCLFV